MKDSERAKLKTKVIKYLEAKGVKVDERMLKYLDGGVVLTDQDEFMHDFEVFPEHHNESWYFNFIDLKNKVYFVTRLSFEMGKQRALILVLLVVDGTANTYFNPIILEKMRSDWAFDKKLKIKCIEPMKRWQVSFEDRKFALEMNYTGRFPVFNSADSEDPLASLDKYGIEMLDVAAQQHYEQAMKATGTLRLKKKDETRQITCLGHRDHSWGTRDWVNIDAWNWVAAQFEDETINLIRSDVLGKNPQGGFISTKGGNIPLVKVEVSTKTQEDGKTPISSIFTITDKNGRTRTLESETIFSMRLPLPSEKGVTEIFEQVVKFTIDGKEGTGISEYLMSTRQ
jgi:hypothetical protein